LEKKYDVYISYSSKDRIVAEQIGNKLESNGIRCWIDSRDMLIRGDYAEVISNAIMNSRTFLIIFSGNLNSSPHALREISLGMENCDVVVPLRIDDTPISDAMKFYLAAIQWIDAVSEPLEYQLDHLVGSILNSLGDQRKKEIEEIIKINERPVTTVQVPLSPDVFISYSSKDLETAQEVRSYLESHHIRTWMASENIPKGRKYAVEIEEALEECRVFILILSKHSNVSVHVQNEIDLAVNNELSILTLRIEDVVLAKGMKYYLQRHHWQEALTEPRIKEYEKLVHSVKLLLED
jgi:hypothetical protein